MDLPTRCSLWIIVVALLASASAPTTLAQNPKIQCNFQLTMFMHDNLLTGNNASAFVGTLPIGPGYDGTLVTFDDLLTYTPDPGSFEFGRGRGLYLFDANDNLGPATQTVWTADFSDLFLPYPGALTFAGFNRQTDATREISVIGGTGLFRSASGYAVVSTNSSSGFATVWSISLVITYPENIYCVLPFICCGLL